MVEITTGGGPGAGPESVTDRVDADPAEALFRARMAILGVPVDFESNAEAVLSAIAAWPGAGPDLGATTRSAAELAQVPRVQLLLDVRDAAEDAANGGVPLSFRTPGPNVLEIGGPGFRGHADATRLSAHGTLTPAVLGSRERFEESVVASLTLFLVTRLDRQPFHAAALRHCGRVLLLSGPSGAGKSTVAYAALRTGWDVLSDDAVYLQSQPNARIWTRPSRLHLPPDAARWFPELANLAPVLRENGNWKLAIERRPSGVGAEMGTAEAPVLLERATLCVLAPSTGAPVIKRIAAEDAMARLLETLAPGFDAFGQTIGPVLRSLVHDDAWILKTGSDPGATVAEMSVVA